MMRKLVQEDQKNWDVLLGSLVAKYNGSVHESTQQTPNFLMFRRQLVSSMDLAIESHVGESQQSAAEPQTAFVEKLLKQQAVVQELVRKKSRTAAEKRKITYDKKVKPVSFEVRQLVYVLRGQVQQGLNRKWTKPYIGPCRVVKKLKDTVYQVVNTAGKSQVINVDRLKAAPSPLQPIDHSLETPLQADGDEIDTLSSPPRRTGRHGQRQ